jgi:hypothetical protein
LRRTASTRYGPREVGVVVGLTVGEVVLGVCVLVGAVVVVVVLVVGVAVVVDVAGTVSVTVLGEVVVVTVVVVGLVFFLSFDEAPKNVVGWPLPVTECPATRSGTV